MAATPCGDRRPERHELDRPQPIGRQVDDRQLLVRVDAGVAVPREVLAAGGQPFALHGVDDRGAELGDPWRPGRTSARSPIAGFVGFVSTSSTGAKSIVMPTDRSSAAIARGEPRRQRRVRRPAERRHRRPLGERAPQAGHAAAFLVDAHPERRVRPQPLGVERQFGDLLRALDVAREEHDAAQVELAGERPHLGRDDVPVEPEEHELARARGGARMVTCESHYNGGVHLESSAPTRIDLAGGTIDIWPLYLFHPGAVTLNAAISLRAHAALDSRDDGRVVIRSIDTGRTTDVAHWSELVDARRHGPARAAAPLLPRRGPHAHHAGRIAGRRRHRRVVGAERRRVRRDGAVDRPRDRARRRCSRSRGTSRPRPSSARPACRTTARRCTAASRRSNWTSTACARRPRRSTRRSSSAASSWPTPARRATPARTTGRSPSGISTATARSSTASIGSATRPSRCARRSTRATGTEVGRQIAQEWENRKRLAPGVTTPQIDDLIARAGRAGATAAKVCGAGGGGCLFCYAEPGDTGRVREALAAGGARVLDYRIETEGLRLQ